MRIADPARETCAARSSINWALSRSRIQSAIRNPNPQLIDPENRLLWRCNIQRLEAEEIRDSLFAVSGWLDPKIGGKTIPLRNKEFVFNHTSKDHTTYESPRRALYLPIIRNHLYDMLEQFDYPDPDDAHRQPQRHGRLTAGAPDDERAGRGGKRT